MGSRWMLLSCLGRFLLLPTGAFAKGWGAGSLQVLRLVYSLRVQVVAPQNLQVHYAGTIVSLQLQAVDCNQQAGSVLARTHTRTPSPTSRYVQRQPNGRIPASCVRHQRREVATTHLARVRERRESLWRPACQQARKVGIVSPLRARLASLLASVAREHPPRAWRT